MKNGDDYVPIFLDNEILDGERMKTKKFLNLHSKIIFSEQMNFFVFLAVAITPLIYLPNPINYSELPKLMFLVFITVVIFAIMIIIKDKENYLVHREDKLIYLYILLLITSTFFSYNRRFSLLGYPTRYEGLTTILIYIFMYLLASRNFEFKKKYLKIFILTSIILSLYGVFQYFGFDPVYKKWIRIEFIARGHSTFGNPNFLGTYLTLVLPIAVFSFVKSGKWLYLFAAGSIYLSLITSFTRSGWLGSFSGLAMLLIFFLKYKYNKKYLAIMIILFLVITVTMEIQTEGRVISRMLSIPEDAGNVLTQGVGYENAGANRIFIWKNVIPLIKESPFIGFGIETLGVVFSERHMDQIIAEYDRRIIFDKAHNEYLHIAYSTGIPSLLVYLLFVFSILRRAIRKAKDNHMIIPIISSIVGYLVQAFFNISVVSVAYIYWIFLGILLRISIYPDEVCLRINDPDSVI